MTTTYTTIQYNAELADALNDSTIIPEVLEASQYQIARAEGPGYEGIIPDDELGELVIERAGEWVADLGWAETDDEALMGLSADRVEQLVAAAIGADPASCTATKTGDAGTIYRTWTVTVR